MNEISNFSKDGEILICGDFNARTGKLWDFINQDSVNEFFSNCPLTDSYVEDHFRVRHQLDKTSNYQGKLLTEICQIIFVFVY